MIEHAHEQLVEVATQVVLLMLLNLLPLLLLLLLLPLLLCYRFVCVLLNNEDFLRFIKLYFRSFKTSCGHLVVVQL